MGYTTTFEGVLKFTGDVNATDLAHLHEMLGEDVREHPEWLKHLTDEEKGKYLSYMDLRVAEDFSGIEWDGSEKTYGLESLVTILIGEVRKVNPGFGLTGELRAHGEEPRDRWILRVTDDGRGEKIELPDIGTWMQCPGCSHEWEIGGTEE